MEIESLELSNSDYPPHLKRESVRRNISCNVDCCNGRPIAENDFFSSRIWPWNPEQKSANPVSLVLPDPTVEKFS